MIAQHAVADHITRLHPLQAIVQRHPGAGDSRRASAAVGLDDVAVDGDLPLAELGQVDHCAQRAPDQALDLLRAARGMAGGGFTSGAIGGGARQHAVFRRHPTATLPLEPGRHALFQARRAVDVGIAEFDQAGALGVHRYRTLNRDAA